LAFPPIDREVRDPELDGTRLDGPPTQRAHPGDQLRQHEGFREIVVGASVEAPDAVFHLAAGGQQDDRGPHPRLPEILERLQAVAARKHDVQDDDVVALGLEGEEEVFPALEPIDREALRLQGLADEVGHLPLILDENDVHWGNHSGDGGWMSNHLPVRLGTPEWKPRFQPTRHSWTERGVEGGIGVSGLPSRSRSRRGFDEQEFIRGSWSVHLGTRWWAGRE
jgi:hypothetical protein